MSARDDMCVLLCFQRECEFCLSVNGNDVYAASKQGSFEVRGSMLGRSVRPEGGLSVIELDVYDGIDWEWTVTNRIMPHNI